MVFESLRKSKAKSMSSFNYKKVVHEKIEKIQHMKTLNLLLATCFLITFIFQ
jgi:hypothetical protein